MKRTEGPPRPDVGQEVNVVVLGRSDIVVMQAQVLFDRGRGLVFEVSEQAGTDGDHSRPSRVSRRPLERGESVLVVYATGDGVFHFRADVAEVLTKTRFYVLPKHDPREMEKREYIRAVLKIPAVLLPRPPERGSPPPRDPVPVELSASGFRWFGSSDVAEGSQVWLVVGPPEPLVLTGRVLRRSDGPSGTEVAGTFANLAQSDRDTLLRMVFRCRLSELGFRDIENW